MVHHSTIRAVIYDMDGVLTDSEPFINAAAIAMFLEKGLTVQPEDFLPFVGTGEGRYVSGVAEQYGFPMDTSQAKQRTYEIYLDMIPGKLQPFPGAIALVQNCRASGLLVAVASSADMMKVRATLDAIQLPVAFWDTVITGEDVTHKKPAPDIFLLAAAKLGVKPEECVVVEDAVNGVQAARSAGMRCVAVATSFPPDQLSAADVVRKSIADVELSDLAPQLGKGQLGESS